MTEEQTKECEKLVKKSLFEIEEQIKLLDGSNYTFTRILKNNDNRKQINLSQMADVWSITIKNCLSDIEEWMKVLESTKDLLNRERKLG